MPPKVKPPVETALKPAKSTNVEKLADRGIGTKAEREGRGDEGIDVPFDPVQSGNTETRNVQRIDIPAKDGGILSGHVYSPKPPSNDPKKVVIFFSGSGGPNAPMAKDLAKEYTDKGFTFVGVDYQGFGNSTFGPKNKNSRPTEKSIYDNSREIYDAVKKGVVDGPIDSQDIILHGFSLGGAAASRVAAEVAVENKNASIKNGKPIDAKDQVGGLVLQSSIDSMSHASANSISGNSPNMMQRWMGRTAARGVGAFDTRNHLKVLGEVDSGIPVSICGGDKNAMENRTPNGDDLALDITHLDEIAKNEAKLSNVTSASGKMGHLGLDNVRSAKVGNMDWHSINAMSDRGPIREAYITRRAESVEAAAREEARLLAQLAAGNQPKPNTPTPNTPTPNTPAPVSPTPKADIGINGLNQDVQGKPVSNNVLPFEDKPESKNQTVGKNNGK